MTHLLDTDICSAHMRRPAGLAYRFFQYTGGLAMASNRADLLPDVAVKAFIVR